MAGINKVTIVGRVGGEPNIRTFPNGGKVAEFSIATSETWRDKNSGERKEKTQWHNIKVQNERLIDNIVSQYVKKGSLIGVDGQLETEEWEKDGEKRRATKIVVGMFRGEVYLLGSRDDNDGGGNRGSGGGGSRNDSRGSGGSQGGGYSGGGSGLDDDEIPF